MKLLDGQALATKKLQEIKKEIKHISLKPTLAAILVGDDPSSQLYISIKEKKAYELGVGFRKIVLPNATSQVELENTIRKLNGDDTVHGILLQLPLPNHLDSHAAVALMDSSKDVDGFRPDSGVTRPVILAIIDLLVTTGENLKGKTAKLFVESKRFYQEVGRALEEHDIRIINDTQKADIVIAAIGNPHFLKPSMVKEGVIIIDVGITLDKGKTLGDVDPEAHTKTSYASPVPGGVGPLTVANLFANLLLLTKRFLAKGR